MSEGGSNSSGPSGRTIAKVALAAAGVAVAGAAIYHYTRKPPTHKKTLLSAADLLKFKEEGNIHFAQKRYKEAVESFTRVIENGDTEKDSEIMAVAYQNRAAARQQLPEEDQSKSICDCTKALSLKKDYARAYSRRAQLLKSIEPMAAFTDCLAASHVDEKFAQSLFSVVTEVFGVLERERTEEMEKAKAKSADMIGPQSITHDSVYTWLHRTTTDDIIRRAVADFTAKSQLTTSFERAVAALSKKEFEGALAIAEECHDDSAPQCALLAARLAFYQGDREVFEDRMNEFTKFTDVSDELKSSEALLKIQTATKEELNGRFEEAIAAHGPRTDFFSAAAYRAATADDIVKSIQILADDRLNHNTMTQVLQCYVTTMLIFINQENPMDGFKIIAKLEQLVDALDDKDEHKTFAAYVLAKLYQMFNNVQNAEAVLIALCDKNPSWSIFPVSLAQIHLQSGDIKKAMELSEKALKVEPGNPDAELLKSTILIHGQGAKLSTSSFYEKINDEMKPLVDRCLSHADYPSTIEVVRHQIFVDAKLAASRALGL